MPENPAMTMCNYDAHRHFHSMFSAIPLRCNNNYDASGHRLVIAPGQVCVTLTTPIAKQGSLAYVQELQ